MTIRPIPLAIGRNLKTLQYQSDPTERATEIAAKCATLAGKNTFLGNARFKVSASNSGAKTFVAVDPTGAVGPIGYNPADPSVFNDQLVGWSVLREKTNELAEITDSVASTQTLTLATWPSGMADGEYVQLRDADGLIPTLLEHPTYAAPTSPGIGPKFRQIDRSDVVAVANLLPNPVNRAWSDTAKMPDGWTVATQTSAPTFASASDTPPSGVTIARNTDSLFIKTGDASLQFSMTQGVFISPPIAWTPQYPGQRFSVRVNILFTTWAAIPAAFLRLQWGIRLSDGTVLPWFDPDIMLQAEPTKTRAAPWRQLAGGTWGELELPGFDITAPSTYPVNLRPNQADIDGVATADGYVLLLTLSANGGSAVLEGYLDGTIVVAADDSPSVSEFGEANSVYQDVQTALTRLAPPQYSFAAEAHDLKRLNDSLDEEELDRGNFVAISSSDLGIVNDVQRITDARINDMVEGDTTIVVEPRLKRFTRRLIEGARKSAERLTSAVTTFQSTVRGTGTPTGGSPSTPGIAIDYVLAADVPTVSFTVSPGVVKVYYATDPSAAPDATAVLAGTVLTSGPFGFTGSAMTPGGDSLFVSAIAEDLNGIRSPLVSAEIVDPIPAAPSVGGATVAFTEGFDPFPGDPSTGFGSGFNLFSLKMNSAGNYGEGTKWSSTGGRLGGGCWIKNSTDGVSGDFRLLANFGSRNELGMVIALHMDSISLSGDVPLLRLSASNTQPGTIIFGTAKGDFMIMLTSTRQVKIVRPDGAGDVTLYTSTFTLASTGYEVLDIKFVIDNAAGSVKVLHVDGSGTRTEIVNVSGVSTIRDNISRTYPIAAMTIFTSSSAIGNGIKVDDLTFYYPDTLVGGAEYLGDVHSGRRVPVGAGSYSDSSGQGGFGASGTRWQNVDADTTDPYNIFPASSLPRRETYALSAVDPAATEVVAALPWAMISKASAGATDAGKLAIVSGATLAESPTIDTYATYPNTSVRPGSQSVALPRYSLSEDPATAAAWDLTDFGNAEAGFSYHAGTTDTRLSNCGMDYVFRTA